VSLDELLNRLDLRAIRLNVDGERLCFRAPKGALSAELREAVIDHRSAIIERLRRGVLFPAMGRQCATCDRRQWVDESPKDGRIRTVCGICGRFIGYRPAAPVSSKGT
jgi:hypothetical protein